MQAQNPEREFTSNRPPLPGQRFPGLGLGKNVFGVLKNASKRLDLGAIVSVPSYFHNALFYSDGFTFIDPQYEGIFRAIVRDTIDHLIATYDFKRSTAVSATTWAFEWNLVVDQDGMPFPWFHEPMFVPTSKSLQKWIDGTFYSEQVKLGEEQSFSLDLDRLLMKLHAVGIRPFDTAKLKTWMEANT